MRQRRKLTREFEGAVGSVVAPARLQSRRGGPEPELGDRVLWMWREPFAANGKLASPVSGQSSGLKEKKRIVGCEQTRACADTGMESGEFQCRALRISPMIRGVPVTQKVGEGEP